MKTVFFLFFLCVTSLAWAQNDYESSQVDIGFGAGLDYGGFGMNVNVLPEKHVVLFGGVGYALAGVGYNVGGKVRLNPNNRFCVTAGYMYGYNAALKISGGATVNKIYYGSSIIVGGDLRSRTNEKNYWSFGLIIPFRDPQFQADIDQFRSQGVTINDPSPIGISVGYHIGL